MSRAVELVDAVLAHVINLLARLWFLSEQKVKKKIKKRTTKIAKFCSLLRPAPFWGLSVFEKNHLNDGECLPQCRLVSAARRF